jgi:hypothetical protein
MQLEGSRSIAPIRDPASMLSIAIQEGASFRTQPLLKIRGLHVMSCDEISQNVVIMIDPVVFLLLELINLRFPTRQNSIPVYQIHRRRSLSLISSPRRHR